MARQAHPLTENSKWIFNQPEVGFKAYYFAVTTETKRSRVRSIQTSCTCREGVITNTRQGFQNGLLNNEERANCREAGNWTAVQPPKQLREVDLAAEAGKKKPTELKIQHYKGFLDQYHKPNFSVEEFLKVCNVVMGPVCVLLSPNRLDGDWWKTDPEKSVKGGAPNEWLHWNGSDNWFLAHPATLGIATGLYRQCYHLCGAGLGEQIIETLSEEEVEEVMSSNSQKLALQLIKKTRDYIEVPVGTNGYPYNYPFPIGSWRLLQRLQRAIRRHGYEESLGQSFADGWALLDGGLTPWSGLHSFWGEKGELTEHHHHLMKMGEPRRSGSVSKSATKTS